MDEARDERSKENQRELKYRKTGRGEACTEWGKQGK